MAARTPIHFCRSFVLCVMTAVLCSGCSADSSGPIATNNLRKLEKSLQQVADRPSDKLILIDKPISKASAKPLQPKRSSDAIKAIYVTSYVASGSRMNGLTGLVKRTELNAMVLDINSGIALTTPGRPEGKDGPLRPVQSERGAAKHYRSVIRQLKQQNIYLIARIVTFKNPELAKAVPSWAIKRKDGTRWSDRNGTPWIDPFREDSWEYSIALAEYAAKLGFDEVQFDYVRFPENGSKVDKEVRYANSRGRTKAEAIGAFLHKARERLSKIGISVSADVFGMVGSSENDMGIGQKWSEIAPEVDVIAPMLYPSHYSNGIWGIDHPDLSPGPIVERALKDAANRNRKLNGKGIETGHIRPWLQSFTAGWVHPHQNYGEAQIREQIAAARRAGFHSYMLWNSSCKYPEFKT